MRYMLLIAVDDASGHQLPPDEEAALMVEYGAFNAALDEAGAMQGGARLLPTSSATTVRVRDGETLVTDGPFAETKEHLGGFYLIEAADLDAATGWAAKIPGARFGSVEIRPIWEPDAS